MFIEIWTHELVIMKDERLPKRAEEFHDSEVVSNSNFACSVIIFSGLGN